MTPEALQTIILAVISSGVVGGAFTLLAKRSKSPESQNELARLGNEFASKLLEDARVERKELKETITTLEGIKSNQANELAAKQTAIDNLNRILIDKDNKIEELELRQQEVAQKLQTGDKITLADIFGKDAPETIQIVVGKESVA